MNWWKSAIRSVARFRRLNGRERWLLLQALVALPATAVGLRWLGFQRWQRVSTRLTQLATRSRGLSAEAAVRQSRLTARMVQVAASRCPFSTSCLERSAVLWLLLRRQRVIGDLRIGVRKDGPSFEAHAWVEVLGRVLNDRDDVAKRYAAFERMP